MAEEPKMSSSSSSDPELTVPTAEDFQGIASLQLAAFEEKRGCSSKTEMEQSSRSAYKTYHEKHPKKLEHCRIIKSPDGAVMAACQLQAEGDPADLSFPSMMRHKLKPGEVYLEWIACHPDHTGKGLGSKLLRWATHYAKDTLNAKILTLEVMSANDGAVRLYERKGFVVKGDPDEDCCDVLISKIFVFCCLGCTYCTVLHMEKDLTLTRSEE